MLTTALGPLRILMGTCPQHLRTESKWDNVSSVHWTD